MDDLISRAVLLQDLSYCAPYGRHVEEYIKAKIMKQYAVDAVPVVRCKDCKHRPVWIDEQEMGGFGLEFPDEKCPCQCDDGYYSWMPDDNWFCKNGERRESE